MRKTTMILFSVAFVAGLLLLEAEARGPRGGGGGGRGGGASRGGGGVSRGGGGASRSMPSRSPSMSRPSTPSRSPSTNRPSSPSRPSGGGLSPSQKPGFSRPSTPSSRPSTPSSRPGGSPSSRPSNPSLTPGQRPSIGQLPSRPTPGVPSQRPTQTPGTRPGQTPGTRPGQTPGTRPGQLPNRQPGQTPGGRPGQPPSQRPGTLPGFSPNDRVSDRRDVRGDRLSNRQENALDRQGNRASTVEGRRDGLQDRFDNRQDNRTDRVDSRQDNRSDRVDTRQDGRSDRLDSRQDFRQDARQDWQNYHDRHNWHHYGWHHGHHYYPGVRGDYWKYMFNNYPVASTLHWTRRIVNRAAWRTGYWGYTNPYYESGGSYATTGAESYSYSEPLIVEEPTQEAAQDPSTSEAGSGEVEYPPGVTEAGMNAFEESRNAFYEADYKQALAKVDEALKEMPRDAICHEFRSLVLFALGRYDESAAAIYAVIAVGPGWDWTTLSSLYGSVDDYTKQLRALEDYAKSNPKSSEAQFLLAYHYATAGHDEAAAKQYKIVLKLTPNNDVALDQLSQIEGPEAIAEYTKLPENTEEQTEKPAVDQMAIIGDWAATDGGSTFKMSLTEDGRFLWGFTIDGKEQKTAGVYIIDGNVLAVELNTGDTLAAEIAVTSPTSLDFTLVSYRADEKPLKFVKQ